MTTIIGKFIDWLLPERAGRIALIEQLVEDNERLRQKLTELEERYEKRFFALEQKYAKDSCFRYDCNHRLTINELLQRKRNCTTDNNACSNA